MRKFDNCVNISMYNYNLVVSYFLNVDILQMVFEIFFILQERSRMHDFVSYTPRASGVYSSHRNSSRKEDEPVTVHMIGHVKNRRARQFLICVALLPTKDLFRISTLAKNKMISWWDTLNVTNSYRKNGANENGNSCNDYYKRTRKNI